MKNNFVNPIDKDKVSDQPHLLPYTNYVGSAIIKPIDKGKVKGLSMSAMYQQTEKSLLQIKEQVKTLIKQAQEIHDRIDISEKIYQADVRFRPIIGKTYHVYERDNGTWTLSLISPDEWRGEPPYIFLATVELMADHTWDIIKKSNHFTW